VKLSTIRRILKEDLSRSGQVDKWVDALLSPLNEFIDQVVSALRNRLTFRDNLACLVTTQVATSGASFVVNPQSNLRVGAVFIHDAEGAIITGFGWQRLENGNIEAVATFSSDVDGNAIAGTDEINITLSIHFE
jgi:hypothetical protein